MILYTHTHKISENLESLTPLRFGLVNNHAHRWTSFVCLFYSWKNTVIRRRGNDISSVCYLPIQTTGRHWPLPQCSVCSPSILSQLKGEGMPCASAVTVVFRTYARHRRWPNALVHLIQQTFKTCISPISHIEKENKPFWFCIILLCF